MWFHEFFVVGVKQPVGFSCFLCLSVSALPFHTHQTDRLILISSLNILLTFKVPKFCKLSGLQADSKLFSIVKFSQVQSVALPFSLGLIKLQNGQNERMQMI